jgi:hypothetical protein
MEKARGSRPYSLTPTKVSRDEVIQRMEEARLAFLRGAAD